MYISTDASTIKKNSPRDSARDSDHQANPAAQPLSKDDLFHILSNRRRRDALRYLTGYDGPVRMGDLATQVAAWEHNTTVERLTSQERKPVYIALYQNHLPKLSEHGLIEYNRPRGSVSRTDRADQCNQYLHDTTDGREGQTIATVDPERDTKRLSIVRTIGMSIVGVMVLAIGWLELASLFFLLTFTWFAITTVVLVPRFDIDSEQLSQTKWIQDIRSIVDTRVLEDRI